MKCIFGVSTDIGIKKKINQDSITVRTGTCNGKNVTMAILCDGMGGLQLGEVASATIINRFIEWSDVNLSDIVERLDMIEEVEHQWQELLEDLNEKLYIYGQENGTNLGSTITGVLVVENQYVVVNVGDSRTYILDDEIYQITDDQSLMAREIKMGRLTVEQAAVDPRRNVLLQCVGATKNIEIEFYNGVMCNGQALLLCSDGFRHMVNDEEIFNYMNPINMNDEQIIEETLDELVRMNMERQETDNITAAYIKFV